jgi:riboflavin biosynthesis pyrimidine reductase
VPTNNVPTNDAPTDDAPTNSAPTNSTPPNSPVLNRILPPGGPLSDVDLVAAYAPDRSRPSVRANFVTSLDGAVHVDGYSKGLSGDADRAVFSILRRHADAVLVGAGTLRQEGYHALRLTQENSAWRVAQSLSAQPTLVIVSASLDLDPGHDSLTGAPVRPIVFTHGGADPGRREALERVADVLVLGGSEVDLTAGLAELRRRGLAQILCEGGPKLFGDLVAADLVDELCLTISPVLAGPGPDRIIGGSAMAAPRGMRPIQIIEADGALLTRYGRRG